jgi:hypothetical protein
LSIDMVLRGSTNDTKSVLTVPIDPFTHKFSWLAQCGLAGF